MIAGEASVIRGETKLLALSPADVQMMSNSVFSFLTSAAAPATGISIAAIGALALMFISPLSPSLTHPLLIALGEFKWGFRNSGGTFTANNNRHVSLKTLIA
jgi:hypothetical protein